MIDSFREWDCGEFIYQCDFFLHPISLGSCEYHHIQLYRKASITLQVKNTLPGNYREHGEHNYT